MHMAHSLTTMLASFSDGGDIASRKGKKHNGDKLFLLAGMIMLGAENSKDILFPEEEQLLFTPYATFKLAKRRILHQK